MKLSIAALAFSTGCVLVSNGDDVSPEPEPDPVPPGCVANDIRDDKIVAVSGSVIDFATGAPVASATVDITTGWEEDHNFPSPECPLLGTTTTDGQGRFGPMNIRAGSMRNPSFMVFMIHGADRAPTVSDNRTCVEATCNLGHTIAAPTMAQVASWRSDLAAGGMVDAENRGLVAFLFKNPDGSAAEGVEPFEGTLVVQPLTPGNEVRFVDPARSGLMPAGQAATTTSGVAVVGVADTDNAIYVAGRRTTQSWAGTGCLVEPGWVFVEDKTGSP